jgi:predicted RNase H-like nuclease
MTPELQMRVIEVHPEVCFWALAGRPMDHHKGTAPGYEERRALLAAALDGVRIPERAEAARHLRSAEADDVLDAIVAAWTARRYAERRAGRLTTAPPVGGGGIRMEIAF